MDPCRSVSATRVPFFRSPAANPAPAKPRSASSSGSGHHTVAPSPGASPASSQSCRLLAVSGRAAADTTTVHYASEDTLTHLINTIEQLKSKDKVISQLERELGHPAVVAGPVSMATEVTRPASSGQHSNKMEPPPLSPHTLLSGLSQVYQRLHGTAVASFPQGGEGQGAVEGFAGLEAEILGLHDRAQALALDRQRLLDKVKDFESKNKQLVEKNKRFLEKNIELTAQNRCLKDGNHTMQQHHKKLKDEAEDERRRLVELARELQRVKGHNLELEAQARQVEELQKELADQTSCVTLLRQACTDKDRRIELIQHRKKRRRLIRSQEKCQGVKETFYGYDDDDNDISVDSENSLSSVSVSTISEEDACDELSREELERSHRQMLREHLQLERSHALLQAHTGSSQDPYRELQTRSQLQADLFSAHCRVELLEKEIRSLQSSARRGPCGSVEGGDSVDLRTLRREKEELLAARTSLQQRLEQTDEECTRLKQALRKAEERADDLEFRILELEEHHHDNDPDLDPQHSQDHDEDHDLDREICEIETARHHGDAEKAPVTECQTVATAATTTSAAVPRPPTPSPLSLPPEDDPEEEEEEGERVSMELQRLRKELTGALEKQGLRPESILTGLSCLKDAEQKVASMERMAMELQKKVIMLQQERDRLEEQLMRGAPISINAEVERRQNLELKAEISRLTEAAEDSRSENARLSRQLEESENLCFSLREQLREFLEVEATRQQIMIPDPNTLDSNKTDLEKAGKEEEDDDEYEDAKSYLTYDSKWTQTDNAEENKYIDKKPRKPDKEAADKQVLLEMESLREQLKKLEVENVELREKVKKARRGTPDSSSSSSDEEDSVQHKPKHKVQTLERQLQVLQSENLRLADKLGGYSPRSQQDSEEIIERIVELEDLCAEQQDRLREAEGHERQTREKLRLAEQTINDLELSEAQYRDRCDELSRLERETKKQLHSLQSTGRELREIIMDKDIVELALREKVEFLEKVEAQSSQRIAELESLEKSFREQLESRDSPTNGSGDHPSAAWKEKLANAEREIQHLRSRNNELEENEEILRENWRRVADEDANRISCLEEKVRMLDGINHDLRSKLTEAQDFVVINSGPAQGSLAEELSASAPSTRARPLSETPLHEEEEPPQEEVFTLKRQLSIVKEEKNTKIANLQERVARMKENEIKLSETLAEMEMTERELRAKLALYESSEVTVEKMLKYQDKINELRTSQESLLDQLETMESQEETLQERLEETERRLKGKIVTLEVEMKTLKQKEHKGNARIRELEKHEEELLEKTKKQADKENGLYVRISGLMDQLKEHKTKVSDMEKKLAEKDERCRKVASLETKFLQIEGAYREKVTSLESSLAEVQSAQAEERRQYEEAVMSLSEQVAELEASLEARDKEHQQRVAIMEETRAEKERGLDDRISALESSLAERDRTIARHDKELSEKDAAISELEKDLSEKAASISELERELSEKDSRISELDSVVCSRQAEGSELEKSLSAKDSRISELERDLSERDANISALEKKLSEKDSRVSKLEADLSDRESHVSDLEKELSEKRASVSDLEKTVSAKVAHITELEEKLSKMESQISQVEQDLTEFNLMKEKFSQQDNRISELEEDLRKKVSHISDLEKELGEKVSQIEDQGKAMAEKDCRIGQLERELSEKSSRLDQLERDMVTKEQGLSNVERNLSDKDSRINHLETKLRDKDSRVEELKAEIESRENKIRDLETQLKSEESQNSDRLEEAHKNVTAKDNQIAEMEERVVEMSSTISQLKAQANEKDAQFSSLEKQLADKDVVVSERVSHLEMELQSKEKSSTDRVSSLEDELSTTKSELAQVQAKLSKSSRQLELVQVELEEERKGVMSVTEREETLQTEKERLQAEITSRDSDLEARLREQEEAFQTRLSARESEFQQACSSLDTECDNLRKELLEKDAVIEKLESNKNELLSKIENLKDREKHLTSELSTLETDFHTLHTHKEEEMKRAVASMESRLKDTEQDKHCAEDRLAAMEGDVQTLNRTIERQAEDMGRLESDLHHARSEAQSLLDRLAELQRHEEQSSVQADTWLQQEVVLKARMSQVEAELNANTEHLDRQKQSYAQLTQQKQDLEAALDKVHTDLSDSHVLNARLQENVSELTSLTASLKEELADLKAQLKTHENQEQELQEALERERNMMNGLESQIGSLKDERQTALEAVDKLRSELAQSREAVDRLQGQVTVLTQSEESLKAEVTAERSAKQDLDHRLSQASQEATVKQEKVSQLERVAAEKEEEIQRVKVDLLSQSQQSQQQATTQAAEKDREVESLRQREKSLQDRVASLDQRRQEEQSQLCHRLQALERREKELLEQITDIEQTVIVPLERDNADLKEELGSLRQQNEALNLQVDKQEERAKEDSEELEALRTSVADIQQSRTDIQAKLNAVTQELDKREAEKETLQARVAELTTLTENLEGQIENNRVELDWDREMCTREAQTDGEGDSAPAQQQALQDKLTVLQDAEGSFMSRIMDLEEREQQLSEELEAVRRRSRERPVCEGQTQTETVEENPTSLRQSSTSSADVSVETDDLQEANTGKVPELFARVQELESTNQRLSSSLEQATAGELDRRQLTEKLRLLEQSEDRLMERVMELEESEVSLRTQMERSRHRAKAADELEEELSVLLQQEDELKEKVADLSTHNSTLSQKVESLTSQLTAEQTKSEDLRHQVETEQRQLEDAQRELRLVQSKLQAVRSEYEEKLSALEGSERSMEQALDAQTQQESDLRQQLQVLREEMEDVCERYKELELENSSLKQQHSQVMLHLQEAESRCLQLSGDLSQQPTIQASQPAAQLSALPCGATVSPPTSQNLPQPQVCSNYSVQLVQPPPHGAQTAVSSRREETLLAKISELEKELAQAQHGGRQSAASSVISDQESQGDSDSSGVHSALSVRILTLHEALKENASLKAQLQDLKSCSAQATSSVHQGEERKVSSPQGADRKVSSPQGADRKVSSQQGAERKVSAEKQSADTLQLQAEICRLQARVGELEKSLSEAEGAVQEVVTVVRTRSVHTLEQKIETIQQTIHTQSPAWSLHQELLELLTSQADLQKQVSHLMETEHNLRSALKQTEEELSKARSGTGHPSVGRRADTARGLSIQSRLARFGGAVTSSRGQGDPDKGRTDSSREKQQWLERQVADLQLAKSNLERRLHEAERRLAFRPRPTAASREELQFRLEQLQEDQREWRRKVEDLEALNSHYLKEKLELAQERNTLEQKLQEQGIGVHKEVNVVFVGGRREDPLGSSGSVSEGESLSTPTSPTTDDAMLEKPEDVLHKRIKELENLESYLRQQLNEVELDRDQLHEITRKDKATIHELNVRLRELMLTERNLRSQVSGLEDSERSLYNRCSELEDNVARLEDRVHELEVHERRLRELVRKLKLDEEVWLSKSGDLATSMEQLSSNEVSLRKAVQDLQMEKGGLSDRAEFLESRVKELESLEATLVQKLKNYENMEASLHNRLQQFEKSEAAAYSKASELDVINMDLSSRLQRAVEENAVLSQHVAQQQGQIHELDRKLTAASDAEVGLNQHVDSLQKSEAALQRKVREYELRDIDAQARIRELEQTDEILKDKVNQLQRSENRLKSRLVEFETVGSQMLDNLPPPQKQQLPQKLEECQKRVVVLQRQLEAAQAELQRPQPAEDDATAVKVPTATLTQMRAKVALLEDAEYQLSELEELNAQLSQNILQLQQGKGSCGHEVELEVLKKRLQSYQNLIQKLKHHLSEGQVPSLWAAGTGQGPESEDLPARSLQSLESERVLHSVRSLTNTPAEPEESQWRRVELRRQLQAGAEQRGASASMPHAAATATITNAAAALPQQEELVIGLSLASESERSSFKSQNDTDSEMSGAPTPHLRVVGSTPRGTSSVAPAPVAVPSSGSGRGTDSHPPPMSTATSTWSPSSPLAQQRKAQQQRTSSGFVTDDSFYLPSSAQSESESVEDDEAPPLPTSAPPGQPASSPPPRSRPQPVSTAPVSSKSFVSAVSLPGKGQGGPVSDSSVGEEEGAGGGQKGRQSSVMGLTIRQRIAQIEKQLKDKPSSKAGSKAEDEDVFNWKAKATENARLLGLAERESKQLKDDINKLEKDLEEKRRYMDIFEKWILDAEEILKNKNKKNDRDLVQQLQTEVKHLKQDLSNAGHRKDDIFTDPAALRTELDRKDRELSAKRSELETLGEEVQRWQRECSSVETMRRNALDALRLLETEVTQLQDVDIELKQMKDEYNTLRGQYDEVVVENNKAVAAVHTLRAKVARLSKKCQEKDELLRRLTEELRGAGRGRSSSLMEELTRLEAMAGGEEYNRPMSPLDIIAGPASSVETERLLSERVPQVSSFNRWASSSSLGDPYDASTGNDLLQGTDRSALQRPRSAEQVRRWSGVGNALGYAGETLCVAILDYQPDAVSRSGHRRLELPLKEGDQVRIRGPVDRHGYCEAEVGGRTGLVPASHLYPLTDSGQAVRQHARRKNSGGDSAEQIVQMFDDLQDSRLLAGLNHNNHNNHHSHSSLPAKRSGHSAATQTRQRRSLTKNTAAPEPPSNLHIEGVEGDSLVLAWQPPVLDQHGCSNGSKVVGYRIYLNGRVCQQRHSPKLACTRVEGVRHDRPQQLAIQTLAASGQVSSRVELLFQGMTASPTANHQPQDGEDDTDLSSILNSIHYKTGRKRTVMGLYDYDPEKQSPGDFTACELAFHAGDILTVYGEERQDGFFHGERSGQRGLVPACFVEPVTQGTKTAQKHSPTNGASTSGSR